MKLSLVLSLLATASAFQVIPLRSATSLRMIDEDSTARIYGGNSLRVDSKKPYGKPEDTTPPPPVCIKQQLYRAIATRRTSSRKALARRRQSSFSQNPLCSLHPEHPVRRNTRSLSRPRHRLLTSKARTTVPSNKIINTTTQESRNPFVASPPFPRNISRGPIAITTMWVTPWQSPSTTTTALLL